MRSSEFYPATLRSSNRYLVIDDLDICVVITRSDEGDVGFKWEIRWSRAQVWSANFLKSSGPPK